MLFERLEEGVEVRSHSPGTKLAHEVARLRRAMENEEEPWTLAAQSLAATV